MDRAVEAKESKSGRFPGYWLIGLLVILSLYFGLGWFDTTTELRPSHDNVLQICFVIGGLAGLISGVMAVIKSEGLAGWRRFGLTFAVAIVGFTAFFLLSSRASDIVEGLTDFPPGRTRTYPTLLLISRAYQTHGKGRSWNIQTTPLWSDLEITENDYNFMLAHRQPGDKSQNADEISSRGYFCAQVTVQQSGDAIRIMHAGSRKLPKGTVIVCPGQR